jgi:hypothetical protein
MIKLTRYTNIDDLKASKDSLRTIKPDSERESDLREMIALIRNHSSTPERSKSNDEPNRINGGK